MQCAEISGAGLPLRLSSRPLPACPPRGVLVRTSYSGICHTDIHMIDDEIALGDGKFFRHRDILGDRFVGTVPGHEIAGVVQAVGEQAAGSGDGNDVVRVGERVIVYPWVGCMDCSVCRGGQPVMCENNRGSTTDIGKGGAVDGLGGYSTHVPVPRAAYVLRIPEGLPSDVACMLPCSALTAYNALLKAAPAAKSAVRLRGRALVLMLGVGGLGQWCVSLARLVLGEKIAVIAADLSREKLDTARAAGADEAVLMQPGDSEEEVIAKVKEVAGEDGVSACIDFVGLPKTVSLGFRALHKGGTLVLVGLHGGKLSLPIPMFQSKTVSIQGVRIGGLESLGALTRLVVDNREKIAFPPTERFKLDDVNDAIARLREGKIEGRAVIAFAS